jgi:hypothetical protein
MKSSLDRLRALAARILDPRAMERVVEPLLADIQLEVEETNRRGRVWRSRWTLITGHLVFVKTVALCKAEGVMTLFRGWPADDRAALKRTVGISAVAIAVTTVVLVTPPLLRFSFVLSDPKTILFLIPQALVLAVPMGATVGVFYGLRGRIVSVRSFGAVLACAILLSVACLAMFAWVLPWANQEFREVLFAGNDDVVVTRGVNELTLLAELSEGMGSSRRAGIVDGDLRLFAYSYHSRWALSCATVILALFALAMTQRISQGLGRWTRSVGHVAGLLRVAVDRTRRRVASELSRGRGCVVAERAVCPAVRRNPSGDCAPCFIAKR